MMCTIPPISRKELIKAEYNFVPLIHINDC
jgi:hypothetical protein